MSEATAKYSGLLGWLAEATDIKQAEGCSVEEAFAIQRQRAAEREREAELARAMDNVIAVDFKAIRNPSQ